jgi:hypothetical protein
MKSLSPRPTEWLERLGPLDFYPEWKLEGLATYGIAYDGGVLTSRIVTGYPYSTFGRLASVPVMTERELLRECYKFGLTPHFEAHGEFLLVFGFQVVTSVWSLLRPITVEIPPSRWEDDPRDKARVDIAAIKRYGY